MKNLINFIKKHKLHIVAALLFIVFVRGCSKSSNIKKLKKAINSHSVVIDSLEFRIKLQDSIINEIPTIIKRSKKDVLFPVNRQLEDANGNKVKLEKLKVYVIEEIEKNSK